MRNRSTVPATLPFGSVSSGTMRDEDLIPAFLDASDPRSLRMSRADRRKWYALRTEWQAIADTCDADDDSGSQDVAESLDDDKAEITSELFDLLGAYCPAYAYFGAHVGDGADYGVWISDPDEIQRQIRDAGGIVTSDNGMRDTGDTIPAGFTGERLDINDHGNCTLYVYSRGRARVVWAIV